MTKTKEKEKLTTDIEIIVTGSSSVSQPVITFLQNGSYDFSEITYEVSMSLR